MTFTKKVLFGTSLIILAACQGEDIKTTPETAQNTIATEAMKNMAAQQDINERLNAWFAEYDDARIRRYPETLAARGIKERMDEWNDMSKAFYLEELDRRRQAVEELKANFDREALNEQGQLSYDIFLDQAERAFEGKDWYDYQYPFNQMFGVHSGIPTFLLNNHKIDTLEDAKAYIARLKKVGEKLDPVTDLSASSFDQGIAPPKFVYAHILRDIDNIVSGAPFDDSDKLNLILEDFQNKTKDLNLSDKELEALYTDAITALQENFAPAYARLRNEMLRQQAAATTEDGAWKLPKGDEFYAYRLRQMTTTDMTPQEVHELGLSEVERIHGEMREIMKKVGYEGTLKEFFEFMRKDPQFYYLEEGGRERYLKEATEYIEIMKTKVDDYFRLKPKADMEVRAVEAFREQSAGKAFYSRPAIDGSRPGYYYANLYRMERHADLPNGSPRLSRRHSRPSFPNRDFSGIRRRAEFP